MKLKVKYNMNAVSLIEIVLPNRVIKPGEVFRLIDAFKEGNCIWIGIDTPRGTMEVGWPIPQNNPVKTVEDVKEFIGSFIIRDYGCDIVILKQERNE